MIEPEQSYEEPREFTPNNVIYWEETSQKLIHDPKQKPTVAKANKFLKAGCIHRLSETEWVCKPLKDYNKTTHLIRSVSENLVCGCQGFNKKEYDFVHNNSNIKPFCSHTVAVKQFCFLEAKE